MGNMIPFDLRTIITAGVIMMALTVMTLRIRATKKPTSAKKILIPPLGMSTGFLMFVVPMTRIPWSWAAIAFLCGAIFLAIPLILTSNFEVIDQKIYLKRSRAFIFILLALLIIRLSLHSYIEKYISVPQTAGIFFILAFGMLLPWRLAMYMKYKKFERNLLGKSNNQSDKSPLLS